MPLEQLQKLFEQVGEAAERLSQLRAGTLSLGGRVAISETVQSVADLRRQLGQKDNDETVRRPLASEDLRTIVNEVKRLNERLKAEEKKSEESRKTRDADGEKEKASLIKRIPLVSWVEAGLTLADYVDKQKKAGKAVDSFTYSLAVASRFLYSFTTGRVITPSGQRIPWRRALARALRRYPALRPVRRLLTTPDILLRRTARHIKIASGGRTVPSLPQAAHKAAQARKAAEVAKLGTVKPPGAAAEKLSESPQAAEPQHVRVTQPAAAAAQTAVARGMSARAGAGAAEAAGGGVARAGIAAAG
ncbi:hypothetical protein, partial [Thermogutta sp.]|uniref:hypothetical protein n=1 Tax=Thermogutta sp. TaxID=1962930 RepID=UPI003C7CCA38